MPQERQPSGRGPPFVPGGFHGLTHQPEPSPAQPAGSWRQQPWAACGVEVFWVFSPPKLYSKTHLSETSGKTQGLTHSHRASGGLKHWFWHSL